jgi:hypothetical protein
MFQFQFPHSQGCSMISSICIVGMLYRDDVVCERQGPGRVERIVMMCGINVERLNIGDKG